VESVGISTSIHMIALGEFYSGWQTVISVDPLASYRAIRNINGPDRGLGLFVQATGSREIAGYRLRSRARWSARAADWIKVQVVE